MARLLEKGYKPEHIELEPKWKVGHGASGGRADILVKDNQGNPLLIIECKTPGNEYNKAWKNTELHGCTHGSEGGESMERLFSTPIDARVGI